VENSFASGKFLQVPLQILYVVEALKPMIKRLLVNRANVPNAVAPQGGYEMATDESTGSANDDHIIFA
jgi:hypothetical protein